MRTDSALSHWHPATKALVGVAIVALPYLAWTSLGEAPAAVAVAQRLAPAEPPAAVPQAEPLEVAALRQLPPLDQLSTMVERPLFSPTRRPQLAAVAPSAGPEELGEEEAAVDQPADGAPSLRFVGTIGQGGGMTALVLHDEEAAVSKLVVGDEIDGWRVTEVTASQLVIEHEADRLVLTILQ
ncbi:MAG TPA: hypothetical protein PKA13_09885 [Geminicoccaceae bacterium]|nr:hypothetical protein [Geminicoccus sp.]HMU50077.1 hypothetical protein [Geminicoccaceae bacterium]